MAEYVRVREEAYFCTTGFQNCGSNLAPIPRGTVWKIPCLLLCSAMKSCKHWCVRDMSILLYNEYKWSLQCKPLKRLKCLQCSSTIGQWKFIRASFKHFHVSVSIDWKKQNRNNSSTAVFIFFLVCFISNEVYSRCSVIQTSSVLFFHASPTQLIDVVYTILKHNHICLSLFKPLFISW